MTMNHSFSNIQEDRSKALIPSYLIGSNCIKIENLIFHRYRGET